jgi:superoxide dismutase, Cu-Zn family
MTSKGMRALVAVGLAGALLTGCGDDDDTTEAGSQTTVAGPTTTTTPPGAVAEMAGPDGRSMGRVTFTESGDRLVVEGRLTGLPPGFHGFHVHAVGRCEPGSPAFGSAGGHLVTGTQAHPAHAGDQPVLLVLGDGTAETRFATDRFRLSDLLTGDGRAVIVHANPDNYGNIPARYAPQADYMTRSTGDAGDRLACGVVKRP